MSFRCSKCFFILLLLLSGLYSSAIAQEKFDSILHKIDPVKWASLVEQKAAKYQEKILQKSLNTLNRLQKQEEKVYRKLIQTKDSVLAKQELETIRSKYSTIKSKLTNSNVAPQATQYIPHLDSLQTALAFLNPEKYPQLKGALDQTKLLQDKFQGAEEVKAFLAERKQLLKQQFAKLGWSKELKRLNKEVYYYSAQIKEYKEALRDGKKAEKKVLELLSKTKVFQEFMERNSYLATFFRMPSPADPGYAANMAGLQTRADLSTILNQQISAGGPNAQQQFQQQIQTAQSEIQNLKNKILPQGGSSDEPMPDFKPNNQKTKSFLQRIEWGSNMQTSKGNLYFPVTSDIGVSAGFKVSDKSIIGIGASYKVGLGQNWQNINITHQGAGLRTFVDIKLKGSFWISGGGEMNYRTEFRRIEVLKNMNAWQQSALLGISKKYKVGKKFKGNAQLLYDFLWKQQQPRTNAVVFRVGYNF